MNKKKLILLIMQVSYLLCDQQTTISLASYFEQNNLNKTACFDRNYLHNKIKKILILIPTWTTGGAEALCQLADELKQQNFQVNFLVVFDNLTNIEKKYYNGNWYICAQHNNLIPTIYQNKYITEYLNYDFILNNSSLVIFPEIWVDLIPFFYPAKAALYWLSIHNFYACHLNTISKLLVAHNRPDFLNCIHLSDSPWIKKELQKINVNSTLIEAPISKYYTENISDSFEKKDTIVFNPKKGSELAHLYKNLNPNNNYFALENLTEQQVIEALDSAKIYIDFGHFPGKDRIPREALARGCIVFLHNQNCASDYDSFPIDDYFRFNQVDIQNGILQNKVEKALKEFEHTSKKQANARAQLYYEHAKFNLQIHNLFGMPLNT